MSRPSGSRHRVQASRSRGNQAAQGALLSGTPRRRVRAQDGGSSVCLPRGPGPEKKPLPRRRNRRSRSRSSLTTRSLESRPSPRRHRICRQCQAAMRASRGIMSTNAMARSACWPGSICSPKVHALVRERHRSLEFIEFLKLLDAAYPASTAIKLILDNHSAHISRETRAWLDTRPPGRFDFTFTPKHGSWLNLIEGFFSKFARSVLRHIRVTSKQELKDRIMAAIDDVNRHPVVHTWSYRLAEAA